MITLLAGLVFLGMFIDSIYRMVNKNQPLYWGGMAYLELTGGLIYTYEGMPHLIKLFGG